MTYDIDALRAAMEKAPPEAPKPAANMEPWEYAVAVDARHTWIDARNAAHKALLIAARSGLLDDAALGRAVRAAANWQFGGFGVETEGQAIVREMAVAMQIETFGDADSGVSVGCLQEAAAAARALVAFRAVESEARDG